MVFAMLSIRRMLDMLLNFVLEYRRAIISREVSAAGHAESRPNFGKLRSIKCTSAERESEAGTACAEGSARDPSGYV